MMWGGNWTFPRDNLALPAPVDPPAGADGAGADQAEAAGESRSLAEALEITRVNAVANLLSQTNEIMDGLEWWRSPLTIAECERRKAKNKRRAAARFRARELQRLAVSAATVDVPALAAGPVSVSPEPARDIEGFDGWVEYHPISEVFLETCRAINEEINRRWPKSEREDDIAAATREIARGS